MWFSNIQDWWFLSAISQIKIFSSFSKCVGRHMEIVNWKILIVYWSERLQFILENVTSNLCEMEKSELNSSSLLKIRKYCCEKSYGHKVLIYVEVLEVAQIQGVCRQSAKAKLKNRHFNGAYRGSKPFFLTLQTGLKFPVDKRSIKDA